MSKKEINLETSKITWHELQRFFASGLVVLVSTNLDLVEVADHFSKDNRRLVEEWLSNEKISLVSDQQAMRWYEQNETLWAVVVKPWVLIQEIADEQD